MSRSRVRGKSVQGRWGFTFGGGIGERLAGVGLLREMGKGVTGRRLLGTQTLDSCPTDEERYCAPGTSSPWGTPPSLRLCGLSVTQAVKEQNRAILLQVFCPCFYFHVTVL